MPITDDYQRVRCRDIIVKRDDRQRREIDTKDLEPSIRANGVLNPIIVDRSLVLQAGERRLAASIAVGFETIPVRFADRLSPVEAQIIELEENIKRQDLEWQDLVRAAQRIHQLHCQLDPDWTMGETAESCCLSAGTVSMYLRVAGEMDQERVRNCISVREAYNLLSRRDQRAAGEALEQLIGTADDMMDAPSGAPRSDGAPTNGGASPGPVGAIARLPTPHAGASAPRFADPAQSILHESFLQWAPRYSGKRFNLIHCDFPYGINAFAGPQSGAGHHETYSDTPKDYRELVLCLCKNLDQLLAVSGHLMFWYSNKPAIQEWTLRTFRELAPSLDFIDYPLIWVKSDNAGIASDAKRTPRHTYETCLLASRGRRQIIEIRADAYSAPTDKRWHVSTKPIPMLKHFMSMLVDSNTTILDPTCGSGSALQAAEELGASRVLGMDEDEQTVGLARQSLKQARSLRVASKGAA